MVALLFLATALGLPQNAPPKENEGGPSLTLLGRPIPVVFPKEPEAGLATVTSVEVDGWRFPLLSSTSVSRFRSIDRWNDREFLFQTARTRLSTGQTPTWRVKVFLVRRAEILDQVQGTWRIRRSGLEPSDIDRALREIALFQASAEGYAEGAARLSVQVQVDDDVARTVAQTERPAFSEEYWRESYGPRFNTTAFNVDDGVDRGPYHSVFVIHAGLTDSTPTFVERGIPMTSLSFFEPRRSFAPGSLAESMLREWNRHLWLTAIERGYDLVGAEAPRKADPSGWMSSEMWGVLCTPDRGFAARRWRKPPGDLPTWSQVAQDPWAMLPRIPDPEVNTAQVGSPHPVRLVGNQLIVPAHLASVFGRFLAAERQARVKGFFVREDGPYVVFEVQPGSGEPTSWLTQPILGPMQMDELSGLTPNLGASGAFTAKSGTDEARGAMIAVREAGPARAGGVILFGGAGQPMFNVERTPAFKVWVRRAGSLPYRLRFVTSSGQERGVVLGTEAIAPQEAAGPLYEPKIGEPTEAWTEMSVSLDALGLTGDIVRIDVEPPITSRYLDRPAVGPVEIFFAGWTVGPPMARVENHLPGPTTPVDARLVELATAEGDALAMALRDPNESVRLNAAGRAINVKDPGRLVTPLIDQSRSGTAAIALLATQALAAQDTPEAWAALEATLERGPFDFNRAYAARAVWGQARPGLALALGGLMTSTSWRTRVEAARTLGTMPGREASIILVSLVQESDPCVRLAVVQGVSLELDLVNRRLLYVAVNDPLESVRAAAWVRLLQSPLAEYRREALASVRDESPAVRLAALAQMAKMASGDHRDALRQAVVDPDPRVKAAALQAYAVLPDPIEPAEIENTFVEDDPRIQRALLELVARKALKLPEAALQRLRASLDPFVAARAEELGR